MDPKKKPVRFTSPFSVTVQTAAQMWALSVMLRDQEAAREKRARIAADRERCQ